MYSRIITNRAMASCLKPQAHLNSKASMSSGAGSSKPAPINKEEKEVGQPKRLQDKPQGFFAKFRDVMFSMEHMDPSQPRIPANEVRPPHSVEATTGPEKLFQLAYENGFQDPYCTLPTSREGKGTKENPVIVESFAPDLVIACVCEPEQTFHRFMRIYADEPKRCQCGYWHVLKEGPRFWEKIPKKDLLEIPFFMDLEEAGLLDDYLAGKVEEVQEKLGMHEALHHH